MVAIIVLTFHTIADIFSCYFKESWPLKLQKTGFRVKDKKGVSVLIDTLLTKTQYLSAPSRLSPCTKKRRVAHRHKIVPTYVKKVQGVYLYAPCRPRICNDREDITTHVQ